MIIGSKTGKEIKELHGVNCAPYTVTLGADQIHIRNMFGYAGIPRSRLHDCSSPWGGTHFVDIPNIFRDFNADVNDPASYDFHYTDEYITAIIQSGAQIVYRLGVSIEWGSKKYSSVVPPDLHKWAQICEHIVRHYNEGWNNGFHYGIEYWEIWNEPENPPMWQGTREDYYEMYRITSLHLRKCFPDIKIGGYGCCGFYSVFREGMSPEIKEFYDDCLIYFEDFLDMVKENGCPLDFFSWHIYTDKVEEIIHSAEYARKILDKHGYYDTECHLNEWNYGNEGGGFREKENMVGASFVAAAIIAMQNLPIHMAQYYCANLDSIYSLYNGLIGLRLYNYTAALHTLSAFNALYRAKNELLVTKEAGEPAALAAVSDDGVSHVLISTYNNKSEMLDLSFESDNEVEVYAINDNGFEKMFTFTGSRIVMPVKETEIYYLKAK